MILKGTKAKVRSKTKQRLRQIKIPWVPCCRERRLKKCSSVLDVLKLEAGMD